MRDGKTVRVEKFRVIARLRLCPYTIPRNSLRAICLARRISPGRRLWRMERRRVSSVRGWFLVGLRAWIVVLFFCLFLVWSVVVWEEEDGDDEEEEEEEGGGGGSGDNQNLKLNPARVSSPTRTSMISISAGRLRNLTVRGCWTEITAAIISIVIVWGWSFWIFHPGGIWSRLVIGRLKLTICCCRCCRCCCPKADVTTVPIFSRLISINEEEEEKKDEFPV